MANRDLFTRIRKRPAALAAAGALVLGGFVVTSATAQAPAPSLNGSNFEIEDDANLKLDGAAPLKDWASVNEVRKQDQPTGSSDDSFGQGSKEDTAVPTPVTGSIPPNKSDLKFFGGYQEGDTIDGFLHLFWTRVQDPSGTTNMDFELNKSRTPSSNGVTPVRSPGDLLITYDLANGGTNAIIGKRTWDGSEWGPYTPFGAGDAVGTINSSAIPASEADGLGSLSARTFGEASVRLKALFGNTTSCETFGSAYLKSRSSDSFSAALKDYIAPVPINLTNCGSITVIKQTDPAGSTQEFTFGVSPAAGSPSTSSFGLTDADSTPEAGENGVQVISDVTPGSYTISETVPSGWLSTPQVSCTGSAKAPTYGTASATIEVAATSQVVCTFTNTRKPTLTLVKKVTNDSGGNAKVTDWTLAADGTGSNDISGKSGDAAVTSAVVNADTFALAESGGPSGYSAEGWVCVGATTWSAADDDQVTLANGDNATCTITNNDKPGILIVTKTVINDNGDTKVATDFKFKVDSGTAVSFIQDGANTLAGKNTINPIDAGAHTVVETVTNGYNVTYGGDCDASGNVTVKNGETATCTVTNDDVASTSSTLTTQSRILRDSASVTMRTGGNASTVKFSVFGSLADCEAYVEDGSKDPLWTTTDTVTEGSGSGTADTYGATNGGYLAPSSGEYFWLAEFSGNNYNEPSSNGCGTEVTKLTIIDPS